MCAKYLKIKSTAVTAFLLTILSATTLLAAEGNSSDISWLYLIAQMFGGLALFLYGMEKMSDGMKKSAGNKMRSILAALTKNRIIALFVGAFVTMVIQSSSATTVMLVSFVQAELMSFSQSLGVILGADIGTTITAQLIAFKLTDYSLLMIAVGFSMRMFGKSVDVQNMGETILGFGILFFGMKMMSDAMKPLREFDEFLSVVKQLENPLLGIVIGVVFTALIQSSSAFTGIVIVLAQQGLVTLEAGIPLIFGSNIGTCVTAGLSSLGTSREAKRVALAHVVFKVAGVLLFFLWIPEFAQIIRSIAEKFGSDMARQIANAHTVFNVGLALVFLPFTTLFAAIILKIMPIREETEGVERITWHLDEKCLETPALAIGLIRAETTRMANLLERMLRAIIVPFISDEKWIHKEVPTKEEARLLIKEIPKRDEIFPRLSLLEGIDMREKKIDFLEEKISDFLVQIARHELSEMQSEEVYGMMSIVSDMESIGDIIHRNLVPLVDKKQEVGMDFSEEGKEELMIYHEKACRQIRLLKETFAETDLKKAREIMESERVFLDLELKYRVQHLERILHRRQESVETHEIHMEILDILKQIIVYTSNIAKTYLETFAGNEYT